MIREKVTRHISGIHVRMLTLTLRHSMTPLTDQINRLLECFKQLRRRESFKQHVCGGVAFLEIKVSKNDGLWHVHLHSLVEGSFWDKKHISTEWHAVTGDSSIIDVRDVQTGDDVARYVTKYVTKPADATVFAVPDRLDEFVIAMKGRRLAIPFGTWLHLNLTEKITQEGAWISVGSIEHLRNRARSGDEEAIRWIEAAARKWPGLVTTHDLPPPTKLA